MSRCDCTAYETCFPCRERQAHPATEPVTAADPALLVAGSEWMDPRNGKVVRLVRSSHTHPRNWLGAESAESQEAHYYIDPHWQRVSLPPAEAPDVEPATDRLPRPATPGPWEATGARVRPAGELIDAICAMQVSNRPTWSDDQDAIAALPEWVEDRDRWKAEAARLREEVERMRPVVEAMESMTRYLDRHSWAAHYLGSFQVFRAIDAFRAAEHAAAEGGE